MPLLHWPDAGAAMRWWACAGLFFYRQNMPLTIRSPFSAVWAIVPHASLAVVDTAAILATLIGIAVTLGYGVTQLTFGAHRSPTGAGYYRTSNPPRWPLEWQLRSLFLPPCYRPCPAWAGASSGCPTNMGLSWLLLLVFSVGATLFAGEVFLDGLYQYLVALPMSLTVWSIPPPRRPRAWQVAIELDLSLGLVDSFHTFVGLFLARVSRGGPSRSTVGAIILPSDGQRFQSGRPV